MNTSHKLIATLLLTGILLPACSSGDAPDTPPADQEVSDAVEVAADGTRFDPPEKKANMPDGAWICDMGTVHFAAMEAGEGDCPVCGMRLKEYHPEPDSD